MKRLLLVFASAGFISGGIAPPTISSLSFLGPGSESFQRLTMMVSDCFFCEVEKFNSKEDNDKYYDISYQLRKRFFFWVFFDGIVLNTKERFKNKKSLMCLSLF